MGTTTSYWAATQQLPQFESLSSDLDVDVVVVGAGLTGITAAYLLKKEGVKVALLERGRCAGADTGHTTAHLTYVTDERLHHLVKVFGREGAKAFWDAGAAAIDQIYSLSKEAAPDSEFKWVSGYLHGRLDGEKQSDRESLEKDAELAQEFGFESEFLESVPFVGRPGI